ncbi:hypothetical protein CO051_00395 [Candidatus Roizmanbacteria bacterium CG_4_9_14_0_2_um_filter_39_13]|uniref:Type II secretion system protein GspG C-terminal domain-containing protein n=2 Tax=Candidatus Roizmaniibacteriota TaxID=1752723 RepID=A0A2M8F481_9BACT|nr:MAG: hypothetical protein CO051_00395 [Candidatus Roizmanbacteria bacterium CG_4_9_14_0_2_um_filter_39_13]PJE61525.1 MAG: hypothetical protein COU87_04150 [Candidatus Roizmanbacteria bacterium CG10_big_fil_rev_8_21_14_0_10_39_12]
MSNRFGFTLFEMIVVIAIIGILSTMGFATYTNVKKNTRASRIAVDFQQMKLGWELWRNASNLSYPDESAGTNPDVTCFTEPSIDQTVVQPYLGDIYRDPWGVRYSYDNDGDNFADGGDIDAGVNIVMRWCAGNGARYIKFAPSIDQTIDGGDGASAGKVRWTTDPEEDGGIIYALQTPPHIDISVTLAPTSAPTPVGSCKTTDEICENVNQQTVGTCCPGLTCQAITFDGTKRCAN